jgi:hypothetical protein
LPSLSLSLLLSSFISNLIENGPGDEREGGKGGGGYSVLLCCAIWAGSSSLQEEEGTGKDFEERKIKY